MSVLNRPLFRQMGGPAQPMPQDMAPAPPSPQKMPPDMAMQAQAVEKAERDARSAGEKLGAEYAQNMMAGIDGAQSTEDLINALRGNDKPLDARRDELAGYVGQADANETPESVLAMVQPVIMMTEEGVMDSGIGGLIQQLTGDVAMTTANGAPTEMGQGVGSLMAAGAPEAPAPQNFRQGGEVAYLSNGTFPAFDIDSVQTRYDSLIPLFESIVSEQDREAERAEAAEMDRAQALLSVARGGLRLAAGDTKSGGSFASQLGAAFEPTAAEIAALGAAARKRRSDERAIDRGLRTSALQGAMTLEQQAVSDQQERLIAAMKLAATDPKNASFQFLYKDGDSKAIDLRGGDEAVAEVDRLLSEGWTDKAPPTGGDFGTSIKGRSLGLFETDEDVQALEDYFAGIETPETRAAGRAYSVISAPTYDPITRRESAAVVPEYIQAAKTRGERRREELTRQPSETEVTETPVTAGTTPESTKGTTGTFYDDVPPPPEKTKQLTAEDLKQVGISDPESLTGVTLEAYQGNLEKGTGLPSGPVVFAEYLVAQGSDIMNMPLSMSNQGNARARDARRILLGIQQRIKDFILEDDDRPLDKEYVNILNQMPNPSAFTDDEDMYKAIETWRDYVVDEVMFAQRVIARGEDFAKAKDTTVNKSQNRRDAALTKVLPILNAALYSYELRSGGSGMSGAQRSQRKPLSEFRRRDS